MFVAAMMIAVVLPINAASAQYSCKGGFTLVSASDPRYNRTVDKNNNGYICAKSTHSGELKLTDD